MKTVASIVLWGLLLGWGGISSPAWGQSALERLEQQIRQRAATTPTGTPSDADKPAVAAPAAASPARGAVQPGYLGVRADDQKDRGRGVRLVEVYRGSPAEKAGLLPQDLITAIAGVRVRQMSDVLGIMSVVPPGQGINVDVLRDDKPLKVRVTAGQYPATERYPALPEIVPAPPGEPLVRPPERRAEGFDSRLRIPPPPEPAPRFRGADGASGPQLPPGKVDQPTAETSRIEELQRRIDELELRVAELERAMTESMQKKQP